VQSPSFKKDTSQIVFKCVRACKRARVTPNNIQRPRNVDQYIWMYLESVAVCLHDRSKRGYTVEVSGYDDKFRCRQSPALQILVRPSSEVYFCCLLPQKSTNVYQISQPHAATCTRWQLSVVRLIWICNPATWTPRNRLVHMEQDQPPALLWVSWIQTFRYPINIHSNTILQPMSTSPKHPLPFWAFLYGFLTRPMRVTCTAHPEIWFRFSVCACKASNSQAACLRAASVRGCTN
jgi:hypothetical protein